MTSIRDLEEKDVPFILDYWFRSPPEFLKNMGVDTKKMFSESGLRSSLINILRNNPTKLNFLIITKNNLAVGFHSLFPFVEGSHGIFHAHIWNADYRGKGIAVHSYPLACQKFIERFQLQKILFKTPAQNKGAIRVKEKLGIRYIGEEIVSFGVIKAGTLAKVFELTREEAVELVQD